MNHHHHPITGLGRPAAKRRGARPGTALVMIAGGLTLLMASGAWVLDLAIGLQERTRQQAATDAGALAGAMELTPPYTNAKGDLAKAKAVEFANLNGANITTANVELWDHPTSGGKGITVRSTRSVDTFFARVFQINAYDVGTNSSCTLGGVTDMPGGTIPFGVPAIPNGNSFEVLSSVGPEVYKYLPDPPDGTQVQIQLKVRSGNQNNGNVLALSLDGRGANEYRDDIVNGCETTVKIGDYVDTQTGNMVGPTNQAIDTRIGDTVVVPLVSKPEWDENKGRSQIHVIGFASVLIAAGAQNGEVVGIYQGLAVAAQGTIGGGSSSGVYAPVLIETP